MCDRIAVMYLGKVVQLADNETLYSSPQHPYTGALLSAVPVADPGSAVARERITLSGDVPSPTDPPPACRFHTRCPKAQELCRREEPPLSPKRKGDIAACHVPLTREEIEKRVPSTAAEASVLRRDGRVFLSELMARRR